MQQHLYLYHHRLPLLVSRSDALVTVFGHWRTGHTAFFQQFFKRVFFKSVFPQLCLYPVEKNAKKISLILPHLFIKLYCFTIYIDKLINEVFLHQSLQDVAKLLKLLEPAMNNLGRLAPNRKARKYDRDSTDLCAT